MTARQRLDDVFDAISETPEEAANMRARSDLMDEIAEIVKSNGWSQTDAAVHCGLAQPRMSDLLRGRITKFSLDTLFNLATKLGRRVVIGREPTRKAGKP
jgi:predicted XRE-type DNA-binding protein